MVHLAAVPGRQTLAGAQLACRGPGQPGGLASQAALLRIALPLLPPQEVTFADVHEQEGDDLGAEEEEIEAEERAACMRAVTDLMLGTLDKR